MTRFGRLRSVFPDDPTHHELARLLVLYEDLKIESVGIIKATTEFGNTNDGAYLNRYFLRRAIATLSELASCFKTLEKQSMFQKIKRLYLDVEATKAWTNAVRVFRKKSRSWLIREIRNDVGGHFGTSSARRAVKGFRENTRGKLEVLHDAANSSTSVACHFAGEITARAFVKNQEEDPVQQFERLMEVVSEVQGVALQAIPHLIANYIWSRFGE